MKVIKFILRSVICFAFLLQLSYAQVVQPSAGIIPNPRPNTDSLTTYELVITDSLEIPPPPSGNWAVLDYQAEKDLFIASDIIGEVVCLFSSQGKVAGYFDGAKLANGEFGNRVVNAMFLDAGHFVVLGRKGIALFSLEGDLKKRIPHTRADIADHFLHWATIAQVGGEDFIVSKIGFSHHLPPYEKLHYELVKRFTFTPLQSNGRKQFHAIPYPKVPFFFDEKTYPYPVEPYCTYLPSAKKLAVIYESCPSLFLYDLESTEIPFAKEVPLAPEHMKPVSRTPYGSPLSVGNIHWDIYGTSKYQQIHAIEDSLLCLIYSRGLGDEYEEIVTGPLYRDSLFQYVARYIQIASAKGKVAHDILIPSKIRYINHCHSLERLIGLAETRLLGEKPTGVRYYLCALREVK